MNREQEDDDDTFVLNFRHYAITTRPTGISKSLKRLNRAEKPPAKNTKKGRLPNLGKLQDISDYMIGGETGDGYMTDATSGSEADTDAEVEVVDTTTRKVLTSKARAAAAAAAPEEEPEEELEEDTHVRRQAIKLVELGPRMRLRLLKVEAGLCQGEVMWHDYIEKTKQEKKDLTQNAQRKRAEKEARRKQQKENIEKKRKAKHEAKKTGKPQDGEADKDEMDVDESDLDLQYFEDPFDSEGSEDDVEERVNAITGEDVEWEDEQDETAGG